MAKPFGLLNLCFGFILSCSANSPEWFNNISTNLFNLSGDIMLGGLFPINHLTSNLSQRKEPNNISCERINEYGLGLSLVMKYAVDEINANQTLLPGMKLGYEIYDTCTQSAIVIKPTISFLSEKSNNMLSAQCNYTDYETSISAVIGPYSSEMVSVIGKLLGFFLMPQISFGATSDKFSDKLLYPSFFRTVPSDKWQVEVIALLLKEFNWTWVAVVGSEEEYGQQGVQEFSKAASNKSICVAYQGLIPVYTDPEPVVKTIIDNIENTKVIRRNVTGVWIGSTSWAIHNGLTSLAGMNKIGTIIGFTDKTQDLKQLRDYVEVLFAKVREKNANTSPPASMSSSRYNPCPLCWNLSEDNITLVTDPAVERSAFSVYAATYSAAQALHNLLGCNSTTCSHGRETKIYPWKVPKSTCSANCDEGQVRRVKGFHSCCFDCIDCPPGTFMKDEDDIQCTKCPSGQWSKLNSINCTRPTFEFLSWDTAEALGLMLAGVLLLICQGSVFVMFMKHRETHMVKASGGVLSFVALISLMGACLSLLLFLGKPEVVMCRLQLPLTSIFQTVALAIITSISQQIFFLSEFPKTAASHLHVLRGSGCWLFLVVSCAVQAGICGWFVSEGPSLSDYLANMTIDFVTEFLSCPVLPLSGFAIMQGFNSAMALISFMCTFMAAKPLHQYNLARDITFASLIYCVIWVTFIPIYIGLKTKNRSIVHVSFTLASNFGLVAAYYFPKCYFLLRKPELNTAEHFCTFLEGVPASQEEEEPQTQTESKTQTQTQTESEQ
ncbi:Taste receptor type 1 member 3 [Collichthys lucidus]|uniref:Taste receptor type 1 member 3 n=1 Tax=Collichthys lucidus TaxID=240159 RepID=A0A4U5UBC7_COLLU|nr:Taste receptor type 1 member 3 [Collichthys lucidus]